MLDDPIGNVTIGIGSRDRLAQRPFGKTERFDQAGAKAGDLVLAQVPAWERRAKL